MNLCSKGYTADASIAFAFQCTCNRGSGASHAPAAPETSGASLEETTLWLLRSEVCYKFMWRDTGALKSHIRWNRNQLCPCSQSMLAGNQCPTVCAAVNESIKPECPTALLVSSFPSRCCSLNEFYLCYTGVALIFFALCGSTALCAFLIKPTRTLRWWERLSKQRARSCVLGPNTLLSSALSSGKIQIQQDFAHITFFAMDPIMTFFESAEIKA